jgi:SAM-dependent methyltransferase
MTTADDTGWLRTPVFEVAEVAKRYDDWAATYDQTLQSWNYDAPQVAAGLLVDRLPNAVVLDIGCGTGLTGLALHQQRVAVIDGLDLSSESIGLARARNVYRDLHQHDFNSGPLPVSDDSYDAVLCVGVMSYAHDPASLIREMCRVVKPNGTIVFSHRSDLWREADFPTMLDGFRNEGLLTDTSWTDPKPYMPGNSDFADDILVFYVVARVN